jgi:hypothetical protein
LASIGASTSAQCATRWPVVMSTITVADVAASDSSRFAIDGKPVAETPPGNATTIGAAAENPSARFHSVGSVSRLSMLLGSARVVIASRRPVAEAPSATSKAELGHGVMQLVRGPADENPSGLQSASIAKPPSSPPHAAARTDKNIAGSTRIAVGYTTGSRNADGRTAAGHAITARCRAS